MSRARAAAARERSGRTRGAGTPPLHVEEDRACLPAHRAGARSSRRSCRRSASARAAIRLAHRTSSSLVRRRRLPSPGASRGRVEVRRAAASVRAPSFARSNVDLPAAAARHGHDAGSCRIPRHDASSRVGSHLWTKRCTLVARIPSQTCHDFVAIRTRSHTGREVGYRLPLDRRGFERTPRAVGRPGRAGVAFDADEARGHPPRHVHHRRRAAQRRVLRRHARAAAGEEDRQPGRPDRLPPLLRRRARQRRRRHHLLRVSRRAARARRRRDGAPRRLPRRLRGGARLLGRAHRRHAASDGGARCFDDPEGLALELVVDDSGDEPLVAKHPEIPEELAMRGFAGVRAYAVRPRAGARTCSRARLRPGLGGARRHAAAAFYVYDDPPPERGLSGGGTVHHVAWASQPEEHEAWRDARARGRRRSRRRSSTATTSARSTSASRAACCSRSRRSAARASRPTSRSSRSASGSRCRRSSSRCASSSSRRLTPLPNPRDAHA